VFTQAIAGAGRVASGRPPGRVNYRELLISVEIADRLPDNHASVSAGRAAAGLAMPLANPPTSS
jgi:hypothetical protein